MFEDWYCRWGLASPLTASLLRVARSPEATTNPPKQQTAGETVKPGAGQDSPGAEQDSRGAVPYISICAGMEQAPVPYSGTRPVPYPRQGMTQAPVPYYGTAACQKSSPGKRNKNSLPYVLKAVEMKYVGNDRDNVFWVLSFFKSFC